METAVTTGRAVPMKPVEPNIASGSMLCKEAGDGMPPPTYTFQQKSTTDVSQSMFPCRQESISSVTSAAKGRTSLRHMHDLYETMAEMTAETINKDEPDVKAFFKVLRNHRLQSKIVYVLTVVSIVAISHFVLTVRWLLPYYYTLTTPVLLLLRLFMYWKIKYQYFLLDFCYFANVFWYIYIWLKPEREDMLAVGFAVANGPLVWALLVFRNSLVFHSLDKVTSLYIHLLPSLLSFVIRWYPGDTSRRWYRPFPEGQLDVSFTWLVLVPFAFVCCHQVMYVILVNLVLKPSEQYLNLYRYITKKETSLMFKLCNLLGPRFRVHLYVVWSLTLSLFMLLFTPLWYTYFVAHCCVLTVFIVLAIFNGATYYIDIFSFEGAGKHKAGQAEASQLNEQSVKLSGALPMYGSVVSCSVNGGEVMTNMVAS